MIKIVDNLMNKLWTTSSHNLQTCVISIKYIIYLIDITHVEKNVIKLSTILNFCEN